MASDTPSQPTRFFVMDTLLGGQHDTEFITIEPNLGPAPRCPQCGDIIGMRSWQPPYRVELGVYGRGFGDLVKGVGGDLLVSQRFAEDFKMKGLTGLSGFYPVEVVRARRKRSGPKLGPAPQYLFVRPVHGKPAVDMERSRIQSKDPIKCSWCRSIGVDAVDGFSLETGSWSGEDVFQPRGLWGVIVVSERFMHFAENHAMSHMTFVPIDKYVRDPRGLYYPHSTRTEPPSKS